jgi:hypothetical protein
MKRTQIKISLDPDLDAWVRKEAKRRRVSISHIVREILRKEMGR